MPFTAGVSIWSHSEEPQLALSVVPPSHFKEALANIKCTPGLGATVALHPGIKVTYQQERGGKTEKSGGLKGGKKEDERGDEWRQWGEIVWSQTEGDQRSRGNLFAHHMLGTSQLQ